MGIEPTNVVVTVRLCAAAQRRSFFYNIVNYTSAETVVAQEHKRATVNATVVVRFSLEKKKMNMFISSL